MEDKAYLYKGKLKSDKFFKSNNMRDRLYKLLVVIGIVLVWHIAAVKIGTSLLLPYPLDIGKAIVSSVTDIKILTNLFITMQRVLKGFLAALLIGLPLGYLMGLSQMAEKLLGGIIDSIRQVPVMAWVPLTIIWLGIGDGPTIFMIAISGVFPIILNTIDGVKSISKDYYNAARSMGASKFSIFVNVVVPASLPYVLTGARIAIGTGWMSVI